MIDWSENMTPPGDADEFAARAIYVICNSGMRVTVAAPICQLCMAELKTRQSSTRAHYEAEVVTG